MAAELKDERAAVAERESAVGLPLRTKS